MNKNPSSVNFNDVELISVNSGLTNSIVPNQYNNQSTKKKFKKKATVNKDASQDKKKSKYIKESGYGGGDIITVVKPASYFKDKSKRSESMNKGSLDRKKTNSKANKELGNIYVGSIQKDIKYNKKEIKEHTQDLNSRNNKNLDRRNSLEESRLKVKSGVLDNVGLDDLDENIRIDDENGVPMFI